MEKSPLLTALELTINKTLALDGNATESLNQLNNKVLEFSLSTLTLYFKINRGSFLLFEQWGNKIDARIHTSLTKLMPFAMSPESERERMLLDTFTIQGDLEFAESLQTIFLKFDPDWLAPLSPLLGQTAAEQLTKGISRAATKGQANVNSIKEAITEFLQEEFKVSANLEEVEDFCQEVDSLVLDVDRLSNKFSALKNQRANQPKNQTS